MPVWGTARSSAAQDGEVRKLRHRGRAERTRATLDEVTLLEQEAGPVTRQAGLGVFSRIQGMGEDISMKMIPATRSAHTADE